MSRKAPAWHVVRPSPLHGKGVFAACDIPEETCIIEYRGRRITVEEAEKTLQAPIVIVKSSGQDLLDAMLGMTEE